jgi:hypothetical protein
MPDDFTRQAGFSLRGIFLSLLSNSTRKIIRQRKNPLRADQLYGESAAAQMTVTDCAFYFPGSIQAVL